MRIIAGQYKGKQIFVGNDLSIRPVTTKIKESIFNILGEFIIDKNVLDLFSGSGGFGLEALSRGARYVTFVEKAHASIQILKKNINSLNIPKENYQIIRSDVMTYCSKNQTDTELILSDPPFQFPELQKLVDMICNENVLSRIGVLVLHHEISNPIKKEGPDYHIYKQRRFGRNTVSFILREEYNA